tara:strand:+ start:2150 stop:2551 length:402 start_codon:yes stop_codon:yes gene_type:complete
MNKKTDSAKKKFDESINRWVDATGSYFRTQIMRDMTASPPTGRTYTHNSKGEKRNKPHIASSMGNPPRVDNGDLRSSIQYKRTGIGEGLVSTNMDYAENLEIVLKRYFMSKQSSAYKNTLIRGKKFAKNIGIK